MFKKTGGGRQLRKHIYLCLQKDSKDKPENTEISYPEGLEGEGKIEWEEYGGQGLHLEKSVLSVYIWLWKNVMVYIQNLNQEE